MSRRVQRVGHDLPGGAICDFLRALLGLLLPWCSTLVGQYVVEPHSHKAEAYGQTKVPEHDDFLIFHANIVESQARVLPTRLSQYAKGKSDQVNTAVASGRIGLCDHTYFERREKTLTAEATQHLSKGHGVAPAEIAATGIIMRQSAESV